MAWRLKISDSAPTNKTARYSQDGEDMDTSEGSQSLTSHIILLTKAQLQVMQTSQKHGAVLQECYLAPKEFRPATLGKTAAGEYDKQIKSKGKKHNLGPPHCHAALAFLESIVTLKPESEQANFLNTVIARLNADGVQAVSELFASFVVKRQYQEGGGRGDEGRGGVCDPVRDLPVADGIHRGTFRPRSFLSSSFSVTQGNHVGARNDLESGASASGQLGAQAPGEIERSAEEKVSTSGSD